MPIVSTDHADAQLAAARAAWQRNDVARAETTLRELNARDPAREANAWVHGARSWERAA